MTVPVRRQLTRLAAGVKKFINPGPAEPPYTHVCQVGDPVLRGESVPIHEEDFRANHIQMIIKQMKFVMQRYNVLGLSACQIGVPLRIVAINFSQELKKDLSPDCQKSLKIPRDSILALMNPSMSVTNYDQVAQAECCASVKGYSGVVPRYSAVTLQGHCEEGAPCTLESTGLLARVIQHEMEHLNGKLFIDSMDTATFQNDGWQRINNFAGNVQIHFMPEKHK